MTTFILLFIAGFFSLIERFDLGWIPVWLVELDNYYWTALILLIVLARTSLAVYRRVWVVRALLRKFYRWVDAGNQSDSGPSGPKSSSLGGRRGYSTLSAHPGKPGPSGPGVIKARRSQSPLSKKLGSLKIGSAKLGNFFKVIVKRGALVSLRAGRALKGRPTLACLFNQIGFRMFSACFPGKGKYLSRLRQLNAFHAHILNKVRNHGDVWVVKYLKVSQLALEKSIAGTPVHSLSELDPGMRFTRVVSGGLPSWIPVRDRRLISVNGSHAIIRWYSSLFSVYRVIAIPGVLKMSTITDALTAPLEVVSSIGQELALLVPASLFDVPLLEDLEKPFRVDRPGLPEIPLLESASSTGKVSWMGLIYDVDSLNRAGLLDTLLTFLAKTGQWHFLALLTHMRDMLPLCRGLLPLSSDFATMLLGESPIGRLSLKEEAAGKVRVFAMVTAWDQAVLKPLHDMLFRGIRRLPNDGTFDQEAAVRRCLAKSTTAGCSFGYDLSAATDRLPLVIQEMILDRFIPGIGRVWGRLLTERDYILNPPKAYSDFAGAYRYAVGQPMGALSSWAMLAVTHHLIAQLAAHRARLSGASDPHGFWNYSGWYTGYEVLGDDIVIFNQDVANQYLVIMESLGVPINLSKSVVATNATFEFAKVTGHKGVHVGAISWAMFMSQPTVMGRVGICYSLLRKGFVKENILRYIHRFSRESKYVQGIPNLFYLALGTMFTNKGRIKLSHLVHQIITYKDGRLTLIPALFEPGYGSITNALVAAVRQGASPTPSVVEIPHKKVAFLDYSTENLALRRGLALVIKAFVYGAPDERFAGYRVNTLRPSEDAASVAKAVLADCIGLTPDGKKAFIDSLESEGAFTMKPRVFARLSPVGMLVHPLYCHIYFQTYTKLVRKWNELVSIKPNKLIDLSLEELVSLVDVIDRYKEVLDISTRAHEKVAGSFLPNSRNLVDSPLSVLVKILKAESNLDYMRGVVVSAATESITKAFQRGDTAFYSIFEPESDSQKSDWYPGYRGPSGPPPLDRIRAYISEFGEDFVSKALPKWGKYAGAMFKEPSEIPEFTPWNPYMAQPEYLYSIGVYDYLPSIEALRALYASRDENAGGPPNGDPISDTAK